MSKQLNRILIGFSFLFISFYAFSGGVPFFSAGDRMPTLAPMLQKTIPSVVNIATEGRVPAQHPFFNNPFFNDPFFRDFYGIPRLPRFRRTKSLGSGFIIDARKGYILTNHHVIRNATKIVVILHDKRKFSGKVIGSDPESDVAVIKIKASGLHQIPIGDSDKLRVGDFVVAIGNPFGLGQSVSSGIVSALGRSGLNISSYENFIQTDASINPGSSGGPLVNLRGEVVGMNTAILSRSGGNIGIGFAIPINTAYKLMQQIVKHGSVRRGLLGVHIQDVNRKLSQAFGSATDHGALVARVQPGSAAARAGLAPGDIITRLDGKKIKSARDLRRKIGLREAGTKVRITYLRNGSEYNTTAVLTAKNGRRQHSMLAPPADKGTPSNALHKHLAGATFTNSSGVMVASVVPGTPAWNAGLRQGDIIVSVNRKRVRTVKQLRRVLASADKNKLLLNVRRGTGALYIYLE